MGTSECGCRFNWPEPSGEPSWHYGRTCHSCGFIWGALHCRHDNAQNPCPRCDEIPVPINIVTLTERVLAVEEIVARARAQGVPAETLIHIEWVLRRAALIIGAAATDGAQLFRASVVVDACELLAKELPAPTAETTVHIGHSKGPAVRPGSAEDEHTVETLMNRVLDTDDVLHAAAQRGAPGPNVLTASRSRRDAISLIDSAAVHGLDIFGAAVAVRAYETMVNDISNAWPDPQA